MKSQLELIVATTFVVALTIFMTWPQAVHMTTRVASHQDPEFSMWRLAWIHHALLTDPVHLFDGNIFHPYPRALTFSDTTLLEGIVALPLFAARVSPILIYNILMLGGIAASGVGMFVLARYLTGAGMPAIVAATIFTMAPYRIEHFMHLELQWTMWIPLTLWMLHRAIDEGSFRFGALVGVLLWLQTLSAVYYGVFLAIAVVVIVGVSLAIDSRQTLRALPGLLAGAIVFGALTLPYAWLYLRSAEALGPRDFGEITNYSARLSSYLVSPSQNWLWGWTAKRWGSPELNLFPGSLAVVLACAATMSRRRKVAILYAALALASVELSLGLHGWLYGWLLAAVPGLRGLRSPSRFSIVACSALAILAGLGVQAIHDRLTARNARLSGAVLYAALLLGFAIEYRNTGMVLMDVPEPGGPIYQVLRSAGPGAVVELPMPKDEAFAGHDPDFEYWSISHWHPILNGYSGYYPPQYLDTLKMMQTFPDDRSIKQLKELNIRYVIVHRASYKPADVVALLVRIGFRTDLRWSGQYRDPEGPAELFLLEP